MSRYEGNRWCVLCHSLSCIHTKPATRSYLTSREIRVLLLLHEGLRTKEIAYRLGLSNETTRVYLSEIYHVIPGGNRITAVLYVERHRAELRKVLASEDSQSTQPIQRRIA